MKTFVSFLILILLRKCICVQPYFPPQLLFFAGGTLYAIDEINQKAYKSASSGTRSSETAYAMKQFPGAIPDSPESKYYVQLSDEFPQPGCRYETYWEHGGSSFNSFPEHWTNNGTSFEIKNFIHFKYPMIRSTNSSVFEDYWYSNVTCKTDYGTSPPCQEVYFRKGTDIPVKTTEVLTIPWDVRQFTTEYMIITVGKPDDKYFEPIIKDWAQTCRDINLGLLYNPQTTKIDLNQDVKIEIWLSTPPHRINGNDSVTIQWKSNQCNDCFTLKPKQIHFNIDNFNEKQILTITRVKDGSQTDLIPVINGGGFDQVPTKNYTIHIL